jgi:hypothetical protein
LFLVFGFSVAVQHHGQTIGSTIRGETTDTLKNAIPDVTIVATNLATKETKMTVSDAVGNYALSGLQEGQYSISASYPGLMTLKVEKKLKKGSSLTVNFRLKAGRFD